MIYQISIKGLEHMNIDILNNDSSFDDNGLSVAERIAETLCDLFEDGKLGKNKRVARAYIQTLCVLINTTEDLEIADAILNAFVDAIDYGLEDYYSATVDNTDFLHTTANMIDMPWRHAESLGDIIEYLRGRLDSKITEDEPAIGVPQTGDLTSPQAFRDKLDELVLRSISESKDGIKFSDINTGPIRDLVNKAMGKFGTVGGIHVRHIDRSLQRLRKRKRIIFKSGKWASLSA